MTPPDPINGWQTYGIRIEEPKVADARRYHPDDVRVWIAAVLFFVSIVVFGVKVYASFKGLKESCALDQLFDPVLSFLGGALMTMLGFYFSERNRNG